MTNAAWTWPLPDEGSVEALAQAMRPQLHAPLVVYLRGDLGAGKTTFARALIHALGYAGRVKSPSYGLLESYAAGDFDVLHLDLYRIEDPAELDFLAIRDLFGRNSLLLVEWPEKGRGFLPSPDLDMCFGEDGQQRFVQFRAGSEAGTALLAELHSRLAAKTIDRQITT
jgi:tRNA threonylcarbamoyladenosine biosynthesis protein TsaE